MRFILTLIAATSIASAATYEIDGSHSGASFSVRHLMVSNVRGDFGKVTGTVVWDEKNPAASSINAVIDATTINSRDNKRDDHLRSADFFDVTKHPTMTFVSKQVAPAGQGKLKVTGDLTIHGVTKQVVLDVTGPTQEIKDPWGNARVGASATTKVNRSDFGLTWNKALETGGVVVGDEVAINLDVELVRKK
jgi:polyisoprenoid-binding protein YceI